MNEAEYPSLSPFKTGIAGRCPRCGQGRLYDGFLEVAVACDRCGLGLKSEDAGDGPAVFIVMILGLVIVGLALWIEMAYRPPMWLHMALWIPLTVGGALGMLRPFKGVMIALHYKHGLLAPRPGDRPE
ncbi:MAG: DUF983 domain-containing protein [Alphaproteobacteria bacterium]|jgi:uncharacterized protein (DUF983 family)|nr:DUF983 domain-containing protein [Alphaproteobacteria bacterium]